MRYLLILICFLPSVSRADISVVTSIRPLYQITAAIMHGAGEPQLLIKNEHSTHHFSFKPSHFRMLEQAHLVIWIDRHFESGFRRLPGLLSDEAHQLELLPALALRNQDGHIWYSPKHLLEISNLVATDLIKLDVSNQSIYEENLAVFQHNIISWQQHLTQHLATNQPRYALDHDFLRHFGAYFDLEAVAVIHDNHDQHGGIKAIQEIEEHLLTQTANCLISNESEVSRISNNLAERFQLPILVLKTFANEGLLKTRFIRHLQHFSEILRRC